MANYYGGVGGGYYSGRSLQQQQHFPLQRRPNFPKEHQLGPSGYPSKYSSSSLSSSSPSQCQYSSSSLTTSNYSINNCPRRPPLPRPTISTSTSTMIQRPSRQLPRPSSYTWQPDNRTNGLPPVSKRPMSTVLPPISPPTPKLSLSRRPSVEDVRANVQKSFSYTKLRDLVVQSDISSNNARSCRASPCREINVGASSSSRRGSLVGGSSSRRGSLVLGLPRPEPSPARELLPPRPPKPVVRHYPIPPPSHAEAMISLSKRLRNRSLSPTAHYKELELSTRPALVNAALGRPTPPREMIRRNLVQPSFQAHIPSSIYGRNL